MNYPLENQQLSSNLNEFTDEEIREQLELLGFKNVSKEKFNQFKSDLDKLIAQEVSIDTSTSYAEVQSNNQIINNQEIHNRIKNEAKSFRNKKVTFPDDSHLVDDDFTAENFNDCDNSFSSIVTTSSIVDNKILKRKIIRKPSNKHTNFLPTSSDTNLTSKLDELNLNVEELNCENTKSDIDDDEQSEQLIQLNECYPPVQFPMKSFIRSQSSLSNRSDISRISLKSNPVYKFHEYNRLWNKQKMPGEKKHNELRWSIREQMLFKDVIVKRQHKTIEPNQYTIPTDKKRQQLRWAVRNALANQY